MYSKKEETLNIWTHGIADLCFVVLGGILLLKVGPADNINFVSAIIYVSSLILLYTASTCYHSAEEGSVLRSRLRIFDHVAIYILIAGSYTPFCLVAMENSGGTSLFIWVWSIALLGTILKIFFTGKLNIISTLGYVLMGWLIVFYWSDLKESVSPEGIKKK
jgi:hemolysin III